MTAGMARYATARRRFLKGSASLALATHLRGGVAALARERLNDVVVLLPGIMGTVLQNKGQDVWALSRDGILGTLRSAANNLNALRLSRDSDSEELPDDVRPDRLFDDLHLIPGFWKIDGYSGIRKALLGEYELITGLNYFEFGYDWRRDNRAAAKKLARQAQGWLENWKKTSGSDAKLLLIAHSMGGLVARYFVECLEGWRVTRKVVTFGTPYRGSLNALDVLSNGYTKNLLGVNVVDLSELLRSFTSVYQLLPRYPCVDVGKSKLVRVAEAPSLPNVDRARAQAALDFHLEVDAHVQRNASNPEYLKAGCAFHPIVGISQPTSQSARLARDRLVMVQSLQGYALHGDGTVPRFSAVPVGVSEKDDDASNANAFHVSGVHGSLQNAPIALSQLLEMLRATPWSSLRADQDQLFVTVSDLYRAGEPIEIAAGSDTSEGLLRLDIGARPSGTSVWQTSAPVAKKQRVILPVPGLRAGTYDVVARLNSATVNDVFLVTA